MSETTTPTPEQIQWALDYVDNHDGTTNSAQKVLAAAYRASTPTSQKVREALENAAFDLHGAAQMLSAICETEGDSDRRKARDNALQGVGRIREALTLLAPDTGTEYDRAIDDIAPRLPDGWIAQEGDTMVFMFCEEKPTWKRRWINPTGKVIQIDVIEIPITSNDEASLRQIKSGKVVPHV